MLSRFRVLSCVYDATRSGTAVPSHSRRIYLCVLGGLEFLDTVVYLLVFLASAEGMMLRCRVPRCPLTI